MSAMIFRSGWVLAISLLLSVQATAAISKACLNSDANAQSRLMNYDAGALATAVAPLPGTPPAGELPTATESASKDRTAQRPYDLPGAQLLDWTAWPALKVELGGRKYSFMGVHLTDKADSGKPPCIRLMMRLFSPAYKQSAGFAYLRSEYEQGKPRQISLRDAATDMVSYDWSEDFYVIDLERLRSHPFWKKRYELYKKNVATAKDPRSAPVHFERLLFNIIRFSRYPAMSMSQEEKPKFIQATREALKERHIDCGVQPAEAACILNSIFMETELGSAHPLSVTDALDNSGLAFGPRQLDLGQQREDATKFALAYLIDDDGRADKWPSRFLRPFEQMPRKDLRALYRDVIPAFNDRLGINGDQVLMIYVDGLIQMSRDNYRLDRLQFEGQSALLAQLLAADFSNKWGRSNAVAIGSSLSRNTSYDECGVLSAWRDKVRSGFAPGDLEDFRRRARHIVDYFSRATKVAMKECSI